MYTRIAAALMVAFFLAGTHWKAYTTGSNAVQAKWTAERLQTTADALKASEQARANELVLQSINLKVSNDLIIEKKRRASDAVISADRMREFETVLDRSAGTDTSATGRADDPAIAVSRQCARSLVILDEYASGLASQTRGLQSYASEVCVTP